MAKSTPGYRAAKVMLEAASLLADINGLREPSAPAQVEAGAEPAWVYSEN